MKILDFQEELDKRDEKSIILGNGFGISFDIAFNKSCFNWGNLLDLCEIEEGSVLYELLQDCQLDFELAHQKLNNAHDVLELYGGSFDMRRKLKREVEYLREQLVIAVSNSHPSSLVDLTPGEEQKVRHCRSFLEQFDNIFSLNYDLLLYWIRCYERPYIGNDSFSNFNERDELYFFENDQANVFFPHGALFLNRYGVTTTKVRGSRTTPILSSVEENIANGTFPICVSEGTGMQKKDAIYSNEYLKFCYENLQGASGTVFTFGCSFLEGKDDHIIEALLRSSVDTIIVGDFKPTSNTAYRLRNAFGQVQTKKRVRQDIPIYVADTSTTKIW